MAGAEVLVLSRGPSGGVDLGGVLDGLAARGVTSLLVEGGAHILAAFVEADLVDKYLVFAAPLVVGGSTAPGPMGGVGPATLAEARRLRLDGVERIGDDVLLTYYPLRPDAVPRGR